MSAAPAAALRPHVRRVIKCGVAVVRDAVAASSLPPLLDELGTLAYHTPPEGALPATTWSELAILRDWSQYPALTRLRSALTAALALTDWQPNEIFVRRFHPGSSGMSPHRDGVRFRFLVATLTVLGSASFRWYDHTDRIRQTWDLAPGDLVLLRAPGLAGVPDGRPLHAVGGPGTAPRCSIALRMSS